MTTNEFSNTLLASCHDVGVMLTPEQVSQFAVYKDILLDWNTRMNLTAITELNEIAIKHFSDSLALLSHFSVHDSASVLDVGSGAGFPGLPIKIIRPDIHLTLLDSLNKRIQFLNALLSKLTISSDTIHGRAEDVAIKLEYREKFDIVTARAVSSLSTLCEYCLPFVQVGGHFLALKGPTVEEELQEAQKAVQILGGKFIKICTYTLFDQSRRSLVIIQKKSTTPKKYPRHSSKISKNPL